MSRGQRGFHRVANHVPNVIIPQFRASAALHRMNKDKRTKQLASLPKWAKTPITGIDAVDMGADLHILQTRFHQSFKFTDRKRHILKRDDTECGDPLWIFFGQQSQCIVLNLATCQRSFSLYIILKQRYPWTKQDSVNSGSIHPSQDFYGQNKFARRGVDSLPRVFNK